MYKQVSAELLSHIIHSVNMRFIDNFQIPYKGFLKMSSNYILHMATFFKQNFSLAQIIYNTA